MKFYRIDTITNQAKKYGGFLNHYEPYQEIRNFRRINVKFEGFSNLPIIFERDTTYKNDEPISDFLLTNWAEIIVSKRIYNMLKSNYSNEIDFYECFALDDGELKPYYILRAKRELDCLDREYSQMIDYGIVKKALKSILKDDINHEYNYFGVQDGVQNVISKRLYDDLQALSPTNFEVTPIATTSEELKAREKNLAKKNDKLDSDEFIN